MALNVADVFQKDPPFLERFGSGESLMRVIPPDEFLAEILNSAG